MANIKACLSHETDNWRTPKVLFDVVIELGYQDTFQYMSQFDQFKLNYKDTKLFCNPPFSKLNEVAEWIITQVKNGCQVLLLIPARTDTKYFQKLARYNPVIWFIKGRLHYNESSLSAPFPTIMMIFGLDNYYQCYKYGDMDNLIEYLREID